MPASYEAEQNGLKAKVAKLQILISETASQTTSIEKFLQLVRSYTVVTELTTEVVHEFIEKVLVGET